MTQQTVELEATVADLSRVVSEQNIEIAKIKVARDEILVTE